MLIRKLFKFEGSHIVRDCSSDRCKLSIHGHSYIVEVKFKCDTLDNGQMVIDFGLLKGPIGDIIDSFDHTHVLWNRESNDFQTFIKTNSDRYIILPVSPSAEMLSLVLYALIHNIIDRTVFNNGEGEVKIYSVIVHETATGYAESFFDDYCKIWKSNYSLDEIIFSDSIKSNWKNKCMMETEQFINPLVELKYQTRKI